MTFDVEGDDNKHPALTPTKTAPPKTGGLSSRLNRWRETDNKETESEQNTLKRESAKKSAFIPVSTPKSPSERVRNPSLDKSNVTEKFEQLSPFACLERKILNESENFRITINNSRPVGTEEKPGRSTKLRQPNKWSGILRTSQSSASDEDVASPSGAKFTQYENITFTIRNEPVNIRRSDLEKMSEEDFVKLSLLAKPPLPPFRPPLQTPTQQIKNAEQDDDSWEDVTTSGTESLYESGPESPATPLKVITNQPQTSRPEDFIRLVPPPNQSNTGQFIIYGSTNSSPRQPIIFEQPNNPSFYVIPNQANSIPVISSIYPTTTDNPILPTATNSYFYTTTIPPPPLPPPPVSSIILEPAPQATPEQIINNSILFLPPPTVAPDTSTTSQPLAGIHHQQPNEYRQPNQSVDVDNFIMLVKPDTSFQQTEISECTK
ncbi:uncharacterized protein LOC111044801 [Nilaparvata lugens]|uniref:uncharacterized protein LOC111044801 n=1 Tax=Nilaparvata lugens TaxID=108931 RepID=UPI00193D6E4D|nr:uncharacterized protein LOC111044801 [Nilaparvata lugens]XP_039285705.1 uncharacterized protein LOC111044801 [Nilaparvata lugens]XP_039285707.1 uncharacterized protein LOC111044801 [Nilaparvata lugens]